jgi:hypothetical protein
MENGPTLRAIEETPYLGHRFEVTDGVDEAVDSAFGKVFGWLAGARVRAREAPFIRYLEVDAAGAPLALEVGVVADVAPGPGDPLVPATLPAGRFVTYLHHGAYSGETEPGLAAARARVEGWAADRGLELDRTPTDRGRALGCYLERYLVGPDEEPDQTLWRTELAYLVAWP